MNGFTFNGKHNSQVAGIEVVLDYALALLPEFENTLVSLPKRDGVLDFGRTLKERTFPVRFLLRGNSIEDYFVKAQAVADWLNVDKVKDFIFDVIPDKKLLARPSGGVDPRRLASVGFVDVEFLVPDGVLHALNAKTFEVAQNTNYTNLGTKETAPSFTITVNAALPNFRLNLNGTNDFILLNTTFAIGDIIVLDMERRTITINGIDSRKFLDVTSTYFKLPKGTFQISANTPSVTISTTYRERWV
jgi:predicted phage tail component-like protein